METHTEHPRAELIARINRAAQDGEEIGRALSDAMTAFAAGRLSKREVAAVNRAADAKLREWRQEIKREEMALRLELRRTSGR